MAAKSPELSFTYDVRNPPTSSLITTYSYLGPSIAVCGNPTITISDAEG